MEICIFVESDCIIKYFL